ncbi:hypothetical protein BB779_24825 (plasmid) [Pseudomonas viridiflava]|uniref:hypothetical protein n=1 Tax=Pseudomonas syringae group TaxID=136849 RepID=UPI00083F78F7|nr:MULTISPECIES: hypothetical protein [Pseudomonas syringae group]ODJ92744.1 hypothetical protein BB779_24825 [Pseudomonas viridiflava]
MSHVETTQIPANGVTPELFVAMVALRDEARRFLKTQQSYTTVIYNVFDGVELLTPQSLDNVNNAVMIAHQMTANVHKRIDALRQKLPEGYQDGNGYAWSASIRDLLRETNNDFDKAVKTAKQISVWASVKIDGTNYPDH